MPQSPDIEQNSDGVISNFQISDQSLIKENCRNSRTSDDIDMKLGPVTKLDKRNKTTLKKLAMSSCQKIVTSLSFFQFTATSNSVTLDRTTLISATSNGASLNSATSEYQDIKIVQY